MRRKVSVKAKGLLLTKGVVFTAELNGSVKEAVEELRTVKPDVHYVEHLLKPVTVIRLPGYPSAVLVEAVDDIFVFNCGNTFLTFLVRFCEKLDVGYELV